MKDKEAWAIVGQFLVDFRQIAGICWEGLEIPTSPEEDALEDKWAVWHKAEEYKGLLRKILDYIGDVGKRKPNLVWIGEGPADIVTRPTHENLVAIRDDAQGASVRIQLDEAGAIINATYGKHLYVIVIEKKVQK